MRRKIFSWKKMQLLLLFCCMLSLSDLGVFAQSSIAIKGQVVDAGNNEPLIGVSIQEKGTANGVITDIDGNFTLNAPAGSTIVFSYIGYKTVEMKATAVKGIIKLTEEVCNGLCTFSHFCKNNTNDQRKNDNLKHCSACQ